MAISTSTYRAKTRLRRHWYRFRLDMTPMVDVAFLLLTFFMVATRPHILQLTMPSVDNSANTHFGCFGGGIDGAVTIILGQNHQVHYYHGMNNPLDSSVPTPKLGTTDFSTLGIHQTLLAWHSQLPKLVILIKPGPQATYRDMVDILDEMSITDQRRYALADLSAADRQLLAANGRQ